MMAMAAKVGKLPNRASASTDNEYAVKLNVGYLPIADHLLLPVSHALHGKDYVHLRVKPHQCASWEELTQKIEMGVIQAAFLMAPLAMKEVMAGRRLRCVLLSHRNGSVIAASKEVAEVQALKGKLLGIPHEYATHSVLLYKYFRDSGMKLHDSVKLLPIAPQLVVKYLETKKIHAYSVPEPWGFRGINAHAAHVLEYSKNILPDHACCLVMVTTHFLENHRQAMAEWVASLQEAGKYIHTNMSEAAKLQESYMRHPAVEIEEILKKELISYAGLHPEVEELKRFQDLALAGGLLEHPCDLDTFVDGSFASSFRDSSRFRAPDS